MLESSIVGRKFWTFFSRMEEAVWCRTLGTRSEPKRTRATSATCLFADVTFSKARVFLTISSFTYCHLEARQTQNLAENLLTKLFSCDGEAAFRYYVCAARCTLSHSTLQASSFINASLFIVNVQRCWRNRCQSSWFR